MPSILHWTHEIKSWDDSICSKNSDMRQCDGGGRRRGTNRCIEEDNIQMDLNEM